MRLGSDPELFLVNKQGKHIAINGYINADKHAPLQIPDMPVGFTLQEDNVALEYGIPPAASAAEFSEYIQAVMDKSRNWLPPELDFSTLSCTIFTDDQLRHPMSAVFGCEPDYCAYTKEVNPKPEPDHRGMRSAGGHIHVETKENPTEVVKAMDLTISVPLVLLDDGEKRKQLYGKAGAFRFKPYGVEYRTPSNWWVFTDQRRQWVYRATERALANLKAHRGMEEIIQNCINTNNKAVAQALVNDYNLELV